MCGSLTAAAWLIPSNPYPQMDAFNSTTDEVSRVWSPDVMAPTASGSDTVGLATLIALSPVPSLRAVLASSLCAGCPSNLVVISWPPQPTNLVLQCSDYSSSSAPWQTVTNQVAGSPDPQRGGWWIALPAPSANPSGFFRLFWSGK